MMKVSLRSKLAVAAVTLAAPAVIFLAPAEDSAEIIVVAQDGYLVAADPDTLSVEWQKTRTFNMERGAIVAVENGGYQWGRKEQWPGFIRVTITGVTKSQIAKYLRSLDVDDVSIKERAWRLQPKVMDSLQNIIENATPGSNKSKGIFTTTPQRAKQIVGKFLIAADTIAFEEGDNE